MDFALPGPDDPRRLEIRAWLGEHPEPSGEELATAGLVAPHWPEPWGRSADPMSQLVIDDELDTAGVSRPANPIGIGWAGPTLVHAGTPEQQARWLPNLLSGRDFWCQLFSEPEAGSDLASLRTRAERDGDVYVVSGSKIWNTWADQSRWGILLARTDPSVAKHRGISYFVCPMDAEGVSAHPIREMSGGAHFCEVFFDEVRIPVDHRIGAEGEGWRLAKVTLDNERVSLSEGGVLWGMGPTSDDLFELIRSRGGLTDPRLRQRAAELWCEKEVLRLLGYHILTRAARGEPTGTAASLKKLLSDQHGQRIMELAKDLTGSAGMLDDAGPMGAPAGEWTWGFAFARALTVGGGSTQVQRNILAELVLGLPREQTV